MDTEHKRILANIDIVVANSALIRDQHVQFLKDLPQLEKALNELENYRRKYPEPITAEPKETK